MLTQQHDPMQIVHWASRWDAGIDNYDPAEIVPWLCEIARRLQEARDSLVEIKSGHNSDNPAAIAVEALAILDAPIPDDLG